MRETKDKKLEDKEKKAEEYSKKPYTKPFLSNYGCIERLTQSGGTSVRDGGGGGSRRRS